MLDLSPDETTRLLLDTVHRFLRTDSSRSKRTSSETVRSCPNA